MATKIRRLGIVIALGLVLLLGMAVLVASYSESGVTCEIGAEGLPLTLVDFSAVPQSVIDDATGLAAELFGGSQEKCDNFVNQLLAMYSEAKNTDFVVIVNPGGWGAKSLKTTDGWWSILTGVESKLADLGYTSLMLNYQRTDESLSGYLNEIGQMINRYTSKAKNLASRVEFLTNHIPDLRVIIAAESNGTMFSNSVMNILADNPQVYCILTGPPFWYKITPMDRALVITYNGMVPDAFYEGDIWAIFWGQVNYWFRLSPPAEDFGTPPHYFGAPGHDYWWQYPVVRYQITSFVDENFGIKQ